MTTMAGAEYERLLAWRHRRPPFKLFLATQSRQVALEMCDLHKDTPCLLDRFPREFMDEQDIRSDIGIALLQLIMSASHVDTALIECWHAWSRRVSTRLGTQSKRPTQHDMFARHVAQRMKRRSARAKVWMPRGDLSTDAAAASTDADEAEPATLGRRKRKRENTGGGGAWRSHVSKMLKSGEKYFTQISSSYRARAEEEVAADEEDGRAATERHRAGIPSFGAHRRQEDRPRIEAAAVVFNRLHNRGEPAFLSDVDSVCSPTLGECNAENYAFLMKVARKADFLIASEKSGLSKSSSSHVGSLDRPAGRISLTGLSATCPWWLTSERI